MRIRDLPSELGLSAAAPRPTRVCGRVGNDARLTKTLTAHFLALPTRTYCLPMGVAEANDYRTPAPIRANGEQIARL